MRKGYNLARVQVQQTIAELKEDGQQQAKFVPYDQLASYQFKNRDSLKIMGRVREMLIPELIPLRNQRMLASKFAFFRGSVELMDYDLVHGTNTGLPAIICGDAHIGNFGFFASPERQLLFDLNDFDEAGINFWEWDLKRLLVSILLAGENNGFDPDKLAKLLVKTSKEYRKGLQNVFEISALDRYYPKHSINQLITMVDDDDNRELLQKIIAKAQEHNSEQVVAKFTETDKMGRTFFKENAPKSVRPKNAVIKQLTKQFAQYRATVRPDVALLLSSYHFTDVIRHSVGVGSFGTLCYLILLTNIDGSHLVLQVKEALPARKLRATNHASLTLELEASQGQRIIDCQKILQSASDPFLGYFQTENKSFYVRQFRDMKESIDLTKLNWQQFKTYVKTCALILANAHAQSPRSAAILGYVAAGKAFDEAIATWAKSYVPQVSADYAVFQKAFGQS
ncbi:MAG: DUF2252 domain-containing protein [Lactobacillus sp.]|jgi:uncharacterized protein (DUF2252 family)|nr:DUF2252 domain-containing protein [Lactobacillus sp.]